jgi:hypothetical protein
MYEWRNIEGADPEVVALALSYGKDQGIDDPAEQARLARQLAGELHETDAMGLTRRESARAVLDGMRRAGPLSPDFADRLKEQIRIEIREAEGKTIRSRNIKSDDRPDPPDSWSPPGPEERPGGGRTDIPSGPDNGPGPGPQSGQQQGR